MTARRALQLVLAASVLALLGVVVWLIASDRTAGPAPEVDGGPPPAVVTDESRVVHRAPDERAVLVEFLDFECEACRAFYPAVEQLRADRGDELTLVVRYFPIPAHQNSTNAALAVEAAARQDRLVEMYQRMYETQAEWGERRDSQASRFRGFAEDLCLDLDRYDADLVDPEVAARVQRDFDAGRALGVQGTPTFFLDGQRLDVASPDDLVRVVEGALAG